MATIFDSDEIQAIYEDHGSETLVVTFGIMHSRADNVSYWACGVCRSLKLSALGFMPRRPNWYPEADMVRLVHSASDILRNHNRIVSYGHSMGAYGAIKYANLLKVNTVIATSPQYTIRPSDVPPEWRQYEGYYEERLHREMRVKPENSYGRVFVFYDDKLEMDKQHVGFIDAQVPIVKIPMRHTSHSTVECFRGTSTVAALLDTCRSGDIDAVRIFARKQRKAGMTRIYGLCLALGPRHLKWGITIRERFGHKFTEDQSIRVATALAASAATSGQLDLAADLYREGLAMRPDDLEANRGMIDLYLRRDMIPQAKATLRHVISLMPDALYFRHQLVNLLIRRSDFTEAREEASAALARQPGSIDVLNWLIEIGRKSGGLNDALTWARKAAEQYPDNLYQSHRLAELLLEAKAFEEFDTVIERVLAVDPTHLGCHRSMIESLLSRGRLAEAIFWLRKFIALDPSNIDRRDWLIHLLIHNDDLVQADQEARAALSIAGEDARILHRLSEIEQKRGSFSTAITWAKRAADSEPANLFRLHRLGALRMHAGELSVAEMDFRRALAIDPGHIASIYGIVHICRSRHDFDETAHWLNRLIELAPADAGPRINLTQLHVQEGDFAAAFTQAQVGAGLFPTNADLLKLRSDLEHRVQNVAPWLPFGTGAAADSHWRKRHMNLISEVAVVQPDVLFIGDSITQYWLEVGKESWHENFMEFWPSNIGIVGETTQGLLWRLGDGAVRRIRPSVVVVMIGTNNVPHASAVDVARGIVEVVRVLRDEQPQAQVLLLGIMPRGEAAATYVRHKISRINATLSARMDELGVSFLDLSSELTEQDGTLSPRLAPDGLHLSSEGYRRLAGPIRVRLSTLLESQNV